MTPQELKNSILQLAIQGKLVEQRPEEGTAAELLEKILATKNAKSAKKNLTRSRGARGENKTSALSASPREKIPDDEKPFDIPESWEWVRLKEITTKITDGTHHSPPNQETGDFMYVTAKNIKDEGVIASKITYVSADVHAEIFARCNPELGDILLIKDGATTGVVTVNNIDRPFSLLSSVALLKLPENICAWYLVYALRSDLFYKSLRKQMKGTGITRITLKQIEPLLIPLPPLAEQKRIVAKIEELLPLIDRYEKAWSKLEDFNKRFPVDMQKSLLQMAIQGKLVEQRPEEGTGEELYRQIQAEKQRLIKSGKIKKEKALPEISEDEIPFEIPDSWKWVRWGDLSQSIQYGYNAPAQTKGRIKMVRISDIQDGEVLWDKVPYCEIKDDDIPTYLLRVNDILFARTGGTVGKSYLVKEVPEESIYAGYLIRTRYSSSLCPEYLKCFMGSLFYWSQLRVGTIATAQPNCNGKTLSKMILPLPPLAEQKRIVAKLEELLPLCEQLK